MESRRLFFVAHMKVEVNLSKTDHYVLANKQELSLLPESS